MIRLAGSPTKALIAEVIYWHELLILSEKNTDEQFVTVVQELAKTGNEILERYMDTKKLSITLISSMTGLPFETIRRQVKAMEADGFIEQSESYGLLIKKDSEFHQGVSTELVDFEQKQVVRLIEKALRINCEFSHEVFSLNGYCYIGVAFFCMAHWLQRLYRDI